MRIGVNKLVYPLIATAFAASLLVTAFARAEPTLTSSDNCYGRCPSATVLSLSPTKVTYGRENTVVFRVTVRGLARGTGEPTGWVAVAWQTVTLCSTYVRNGEGRCSPSATALPVGSYTIVARYVGNRMFEPSTSRGQTLIVASYRHYRHRHPRHTLRAHARAATWHLSS